MKNLLISHNSLSTGCCLIPLVSSWKSGQHCKCDVMSIFVVLGSEEMGWTQSRVWHRGRWARCVRVVWQKEVEKNEERLAKSKRGRMKDNDPLKAAFNSLRCEQELPHQCQCCSALLNVVDAFPSCPPCPFHWVWTDKLHPHYSGEEVDTPPQHGWISQIWFHF